MNSQTPIMSETSGHNQASDHAESTLMHIACENGRADVAALLTSCGANVANFGDSDHLVSWVDRTFVCILIFLPYPRVEKYWLEQCTPC
jgi:hypothetical protein